MSTRARAAVGPYTWDDFVALGEDDRRQLIDGELVEIDVTNTLRHEHAVAGLIFYLRGFAEQHGGLVLASLYGVRISEKRGVMPDVQLYRAGNEPGIDQNTGLVRGRPDLVVEVISPSSRRYDRIIKLGYYASVKVPEYWLVDPDACVLERLVYSPKGYVIADVHEGGESFAPPTFPGLEVPLARVWLAPSAPRAPTKARATRRRPKTKPRSKTKR